MHIWKSNISEPIVQNLSVSRRMCKRLIRNGRNHFKLRMCDTNASNYRRVVLRRQNVCTNLFVRVCQRLEADKAEISVNFAIVAHALQSINDYLGSDSHDEIALANKIAGRQPTKFATWARANFPIQSSVAA